MNKTEVFALLSMGAVFGFILTSSLPDKKPPEFVDRFWPDNGGCTVSTRAAQPMTLDGKPTDVHEAYGITHYSTGCFEMQPECVVTYSVYSGQLGAVSNLVCGDNAKKLLNDVVQMHEGLLQ